ncbi:hypothetical protein [Limobrevibacterium gyesilva]|uniref:Uncharacterized protein n=1 Tax=Limobrevibacterium gyesilva TaxID=2991712 RepID=A0AA42CCU7_9PROT|nr:hypothetical protein [Limobrevibacterium gyesilva]MCW3474003.1 hypothetical protein [Limobrevibacterium gyesilva]
MLPALVIILLIPLAVTEIPPLVDYPNHLARMFVLASGASDPFLSRVYAQHWSIIPNIAIDVVVPPLLAVMPLDVAGRAMLAAALLLPVFGTIAYSRATLRAPSPWPLASGLVAYNFAFLMGFVNFLAGIGAALLAAACWIRWRGSRPVAAWVLLACLALVIFFVHIFGVLFLGLLIAAHELVALWGEWRSGAPVLRRAARRAAFSASVFAAPAALFLQSRLASIAEQSTATDPYWKLVRLFGPFLNYDLTFDRATAALVAVFVIACILGRRAAVSAEAVIAGGVLLALYPFTPGIVKGTAFIDARLPVMAGFLLFGGFAPRGLPPGLRVGATAAFCALFLARMAFLTQVWLGQGSDLADFRRVIARIEPGSRVLETMVTRRDNPAFWNAMPYRRVISGGDPTFTHLAALVVTERGSMWPLLFTNPTKQPLTVRPAYLPMTEPEGVVPDYRLLASDRPPEAGRRVGAYLEDWPAKFDYVLVMAAGGAKDLATFRTDRLELVEQTEFAALMRVRRPAAQGAPP